MLHSLKYDVQQQEKLTAHYEKAFINEKELTKQLNHQLDDSADKNMKLSNLITELRAQVESLTDKLKQHDDRSRFEHTQQQLERHVSSLKSDNQQLQQENSDLKEQNRSQKEQYRSVELELTQKDRKVNHLTEENAHLQALCDKHDSYADGMAKKLNETQQQLHELQKRRNAEDSSVQEFKLSAQQELEASRERIERQHETIISLESKNQELEAANYKLQRTHNDRIQQMKKTEKHMKASFEEMQQINAKLDRNNSTLHERLDNMLKDNTKLKQTLLDLEHGGHQEHVRISKDKLTLWRKSKRLLQERVDHLQDDLGSLNKENVQLRRRLLEADSQQHTMLNQTQNDFQTLQTRYSTFVSKYEQLIEKYKSVKQKNVRYKKKYGTLKEQLSDMKREQGRLRSQIEILMEKDV